MTYSMPDAIADSAGNSIANETFELGCVMPDQTQMNEQIALSRMVRAKQSHFSSPGEKVIDSRCRFKADRAKKRRLLHPSEHDRSMLDQGFAAT